MAELYWIRTEGMKDMFSEGYVGISTISAQRRWNYHKAAAKDPTKSHLPIYRAFVKYGVDQLIMSVVLVGSEDYVKDMECKFRPTERIGWNLAVGGQDTGRGRTHSEEEIAKRLKSREGYRHSEDTKVKISQASKGRAKSEGHKEAIRQTRLGSSSSEETRRKISLSNMGKVMSESFKNKMSEIAKNKKPWEHSKVDKLLWSNAIEICAMQPTLKSFSTTYVGRELNMKPCSVFTIVDKIKSGWNPSEDLDYLAWLEEYKHKECSNGTFIT